MHPFVTVVLNAEVYCTGQEVMTEISSSCVVSRKSMTIGIQGSFKSQERPKLGKGPGFLPSFFSERGGGNLKTIPLPFLG